MSLPAAPSDLDATWVRHALAGEADLRAGEFRAVRAEVIGVGYGLDGTVARVTAVDANGDESTFVAKWCRAKDGETERRFYRDVAPHLGIEVPRLYATFVEGDRALLLLEDVAPSRQGDAIVGATPEDAQRLMEVAACFHARYWGRTEDPRAAGLLRWGTDPAGVTQRTLAFLPRFLERWRPALTPGVVAVAERLPESLPAAYEALAAAPATVIHGDLHLDNVLFRPDGAPVVIDWTHSALGPGAVDVVRLLVEGMTYEARREHETALVDRYLRALSRRGIRCDAAAFDTDMGHALTVAYSGAIRWKEPAPDSPARLVPIIENLVRNVTAMVEDRLCRG